MIQIFRQTKHYMKYLLWVWNGYICRHLTINTPHKVTVLLTYYHPIWMTHINNQIRNILKCNFVEKIVITNNNPNVKIEEKIKFRDDRLTWINQEVRRYNGYRWHIANTLDTKYFIVIDDDVLLFPSQLKSLFQHLILEPSIPHGFSGQLHLPNDEFWYRECENIDVDYLCELYAVTQHHIHRYAEIAQLISDEDKTLSDFIERFADHIVISQTTPHNPKIHKISRLLRSETFKTPGIATHKDEHFEESVIKVCRAVRKLKLQTFAYNQQPNIS